MLISKKIKLYKNYKTQIQQEESKGKNKISKQLKLHNNKS